jgi:hypothetical protein
MTKSLSEEMAKDRLGDKTGEYEGEWKEGECEEGIERARGQE